MWPCALVSLVFFMFVWFLTFGLLFKYESPAATTELNVIRQVTLNASDAAVEKGLRAKGKVKQHVPKFMLELYEKSKTVKPHEVNGLMPEIVRSVVPTHSENLLPYFIQENVNNDHHLLVFIVPTANTDEQFVKAELRILTLVQTESKTVAFGIERSIKISLYNETTQQLLTLDEKHVYHSDNTWIAFNVSKPVHEILKQTSDGTNPILKLVITIKSFLPYIDSRVGTFKISLMPIREDFDHDYPVLLLFYVSTKSDSENVTNVGDNKKNKRIKRGIEDEFEEESNKLWEDDGVDRSVNRRIRRNRNLCRRKPLYIDFAEIQYDTWIVQPSGYEAYQCAGKCFYPVAEHLSPTKHAIVQALLHSVAPSRAPRSCCVPTALDSISVLYVDSNGVLTYRYGYKDMVVAQCGCR